MSINIPWLHSLKDGCDKLCVSVTQVRQQSTKQATLLHETWKKGKWGFTLLVRTQRRKLTETSIMAQKVAGDRSVYWHTECWLVSERYHNHFTARCTPPLFVNLEHAVCIPTLESNVYSSEVNCDNFLVLIVDNYKTNALYVGKWVFDTIPQIQHLSITVMFRSEPI